MSEPNLEQIFDSLNALALPVLICDQTLTVQKISPAAAQMLAPENETIAGKSLQSFAYLQPLSIMLRNKPQSGLTIVPLSEQHKLLVRIRVLDDNRGYLLLLDDVSEVLKSDEEQATAMSMVVHDLKAPLSAIKSYAELVANTGSLDARQKQFLSRIQQAVRNMTNMVGDLLDMAWIDSRKPLEMQRVNIASLVNMTVETLQERANGRGLWLNAQFSPDLPYVMGDPRRLQRVLTNLITNAIKFSPEGESIQVSVLAAGKNITISVADNGTGIPPEHLSHIFERFYRVEQEKDIEGSGLGLSIVKAIVERHHGQVEVRSKPGEGSTFMVILPVLKA